MFLFTALAVNLNILRVKMRFLSIISPLLLL